MSRDWQDGREAWLTPGDFTLRDCTRPYEVQFNEPVSMLALRIPDEVFRRYVAHPENVVAVAVTGSRGASGLVFRFLRDLWSNPEAVPDADFASRLAPALLELIATAYLTVPQAHARRPPLMATPRRRLEACSRALSSPLHLDRSITFIACQHGFNSLAHFGKVFRDRYGVSPGEYRRGCAAGPLIPAGISSDDCRRQETRRTQPANAAQGARVFGGHMVASAALVEQIDVREPEERRIAWATAVSVLLHVGVLLSVGIVSAPSTDFSSVPELNFDVTLDDGHDTEHDNSPAIERSAAPTTTVSEASPAAIADNHPSEIEPPPVVASASPAPRQNEAIAEDSLSDTSVPSEPADSTANSEILATSGPSEVEVPIAAEPAKPDAPEQPIPAAEQALLTHKVMEGAQGLEDTDLNETRMSWQQDGHEYTAVLTRQPAADNTGIDRMIVEVVTEDRGKRLRTKMQMKRLAFSSFTQLVDRWDQDVQLHDDEIVGRFHSNSEILLGYDRTVAPKFLGKVTTAARGVTIASAMGRKERSEIFRAGIETRASRITLPAKFLPFASNPGAQKVEVQSYTGDTHLTFYADGTYGWQPARRGSTEQRQALSSATTYIVGARDTTFYVHGTVSGKVLVYSPDLIVVEGHLIYAHDPRSPTEGNDYLGLVSDNYIEVARPSVTGPGDLEIDAAIYAKRRFVVTDEQTPANATLFIYGSLTAGTLSATEPRYATKLKFDPRFEEQRPPGFPVTNRYELEGWDAQWQVAHDDP